tara:strand:+ start:427 stop:1887 length:1461 start_codon:yes stop_codon:yes gene_type:complete
MDKELIPYLQSLNGILANISNLEVKNEMLAMQIELARHLIDLLIVKTNIAPFLSNDCISSLPEIINKTEKILPVSKSKTFLLRELKKINEPNSNSYNKFLEISGKLQIELIKVNSNEALELSKQIFRIEADYSKNFLSAVLTQNKLEDTNNDISSARNTRSFKTQDLVTFIQDTFQKDGNTEIIDTKFITGGYSKFTMDIHLIKTTTLPKNIILRADADGEFGGMSVVDEYQLLDTVYQNGVSAPKPFAINKNHNIFGTPFMLMEKIPGECIGHMYNIPPINSDNLVLDIATKLSSIHGIPIKMFHNKTNGANCSSSQMALEWISSSEAMWLPLNLPSPAFTTAFEWLKQNTKLYDNGPRSLVHGDYGLNNLLIKDEYVTGILDWEHAHIGNPSYDLGYFHPMAEKLSSWQKFLDAYANTGISMPNEDQINFSILFGAIRVGVMVCQVRSAFINNHETGIAATIGVADDYYDMAVTRISSALENVL